MPNAIGCDHARTEVGYPDDRYVSLQVRTVASALGCLCSDLQFGASVSGIENHGSIVSFTTTTSVMNKIDVNTYYGEVTDIQPLLLLVELVTGTDNTLNGLRGQQRIARALLMVIAFQQYGDSEAVGSAFTLGAMLERADTWPGKLLEAAILKAVEHDADLNQTLTKAIKKNSIAA